MGTNIRDSARSARHRRKSHMDKTHRPGIGIRLINAVVKPVLRSGVTLGPLVLLTVPGRASGLPRTTPVALGEANGERWLVASFGEVDWVRNLRAAGGGALTRGRRSEDFVGVELPPALAAPLLRNSLSDAPPPIRKQFAVTSDSSLEDLEREVARHPVFQILPAGKATIHPLP